MILLDNLTDSANQTSVIPLADGSALQLTFKYRPAVQRWTVDAAYKSFSEYGIGLSAHPNLLRTWRHVIPCGLLVKTVDLTDPFMADDLSSGRVTVVVLDSTGSTDEVEAVEQEYFQ